MTNEECRAETIKHIDKVKHYTGLFTNMLTKRGINHDKSKLESPEIEVFAEHTPSLKDSEYGQQSYTNNLEQMKPALEHHYANNRHHPEHFKDGINDMNLVDIVEMFCDWKAASQRQKNGNLLKSIEINASRFKCSPQLKRILENTAKLLDETEES